MSENVAEIAPIEIILRRRSRLLQVSFADGNRFELPFEYLRVHSPSAEVRGHGAGEGVLVTGKRDVMITAVEPIGQYAVRLIFDDGHDTGLFTWKYLHELGAQRERKWSQYLERVARATHSTAAADTTGAVGTTGAVSTTDDAVGD